MHFKTFRWDYIVAHTLTLFIIVKLGQGFKCKKNLKESEHNLAIGYILMVKSLNDKIGTPNTTYKVAGPSSMIYKHTVKLFSEFNAICNIS